MHFFGGGIDDLKRAAAVGLAPFAVDIHFLSVAVAVAILVSFYCPEIPSVTSVI